MGNDVVRLCLKVWNWAMGVGGVVTITYAILMFRVSQSSSSSQHNITLLPWFFHAILFVGIVLCAVTLLGHLAATTANNCCLSTYIVVVLLLLIFETVIMVHAFLDPTWEKDLPVVIDSFDDFTDSLVSASIWKCLASLVFLIQAVCVLLAALSIHAIDEVYGRRESDQYEDEEHRLPLLDTVARWQQEERRIGEKNLDKVM